MKRFFILCLALLAGNVFAQRMNVQTTDDSLKSFDLAKIKNISFFVNDTVPYSEPKATELISISGNLSAENGPFFGDINNSTNEFVGKNWTVEDNSGNKGVLYFQYVKTGGNSWAFTINDSLGGIFNECTGVLCIDNDGNILTSQTISGVPLTFTPNGVGANAVYINQPATGVNIFSSPSLFVYFISVGGNADIFHPSYLPDFHDIVGAIYDSKGAKHFVTLRFEEIAPIGSDDAWSCNLISVTKTDPLSALPFQFSGVIQFNVSGKYSSLQNLSPFQILPANNAAEILINIFHLSAMTQYSGKTFYAFQQDGSPASR